MWGGKCSLDWEGAEIDREPAQGEIWGQLSLDTVQGTSLRLAPKYGGQQRHLVLAGATAGRRLFLATSAVHLSPMLGTTLREGGGIPSSPQEREVSGGTC